MIPGKDAFDGRLIHSWFTVLGEQERAGILSAMAQGYEELSALLLESFPAVAEEMEQLQRYLHERLREGIEEEVRKELAQEGITEPALMTPLIAAARNALRMYDDAAYLRNTDRSEFARVVSVILQDIFVDRRYRSLERAQHTLQIDDEDTTFKTYMVVRQLLQSFYEQHLSFEELEDFMTEELKFDAKRIMLFCDLMLERKAGLDSYFQFRNMTRIMKMLNEL